MPDKGQTYPSCDAVLSVVSFEIFVRLRIVLPELFNDILTNITEILLNLSGNLELVLRRHRRHLPTFSHEIQDKLGDITSRNRDMLDRASDNVALRAGDNVGNAVPGVDDGSGQRTIRDSVGTPRSSEGQNGLHGDVKPLDVERLEKYLCRLLSVFRRVQGWFRLSYPNSPSIYK
jgi:hypothetical protein